MKDIPSKLDKISKINGATVKVEPAQDGSYIDYLIKKGGVDLYVLISKIENVYYAYGLESNLLPRGLYTDTLKNDSFSLESRSEEILNNVETLLSEKLKIENKPSFFNKKSAVISLSIDGKLRKMKIKDGDPFR